uniref:Protein DETOXIFICATION n=1 Tax=Setaria italica TaxID=4555 RepID=K3ZMK7_SETIT
MAAAAAVREEAAPPPLLLLGEGHDDHEEEEASWWMVWAREAGRVGYVAAPMVVVSLSQFGVQVSSNMMVGHLPGELPLSSAAIATSLANVSGFSLLVHMISNGAGRYMISLIPGLFASAVIQPITKFLQSQSLVYPLLLSSIATMVIHILLCYVMVFKTGFGYTGAALAVSISFWLNVAMLVGYVMFSSSCKETRTPLTIDTFKGVDTFLRLALPTALMICLELWSFELLILVSGLLPNPELETSVLSICLTSVTLISTVPFGVGAAASTRVANELGSGNPSGARSVVRIAMSITMTGAVIMSGTLLVARHLLGRAYSDEEEVISFVASMVPLVCITVVTDAVQGVLAGVARGCGWQHLAAYVNFGSFYLLGIPVAIVLSFVLRLGARGLWMGVVCGSLTQTTLMGAITFFINWPKMAEETRERAFSEKLAESGSLLEPLH